jgi:hypothetical protein
MFDTYWYDYEDCKDIKELIANAISASRTEYVWLRHHAVDYSNFNLRFMPSRHQLNMMHAWASHDNPLCYTTWLIPVENNGNMVFHDQILPIITPPQWDTSDQVLYDDFNFNWYPDVWDWNKQHHFAMAGTTQLSYTSVGNGSEIKYHRSELRFKAIGIWYDASSVDDSPYEWNWIADNRINYADFNWNWLPDAWDADKIHEFCMYGSKHLSYTRLMNKNNSGKQVFHHSYIQFKPNITPVIYWQDFFEELSLDNLKQLAQGNEWTWIADKRIDYGDWNFDWLPDGWDTNYIHCFTMSGKEQLSYTWLVHRDAMADFVDYKYHESQLKFKDAHADMCFCNTNTFTNPLVVDFQVRLITTMEEVIKSAVKKSNREWLWIYSDVCDYDSFDWTWLPDLDQRDQIHCWPSGICEKGDTFLIHVPSFDPDKLKFNFDHEPLQRKRWPVISVTDNCLAWDLNNQTRNHGIYTVYSYTGFVDYPDVCLWDKRPVVSLNRSNSTCLVPRDCIVKKEIYEYPHLLRYPEYGTDIPIDVIFIHNKESCAEDNWVRLKTVCQNAKMVSGINGRLDAYRAAAFQSDTPWFIAVFAKCHVLDNFAELNWQPDFWQEPKHYIFHNRNLNTGLEYGHMAPIAYHCQLLYENRGGLDMTLAQRHTTVPITISENNLEGDDWITWRTAFREVIKILHYSRENPSVENEYRLWAWRNIANGNNASLQRLAVKHAEEYYLACGGNVDALILTSEWNWLYEHYFRLIPQTVQLQ